MFANTTVVSLQTGKPAGLTTRTWYSMMKTSATLARTARNWWPWRGQCWLTPVNRRCGWGWQTKDWPIPASQSFYFFYTEISVLAYYQNVSWQTISDMTLFLSVYWLLFFFVCMIEVCAINNLNLIATHTNQNHYFVSFLTLSQTDLQEFSLLWIFCLHVCVLNNWINTSAYTSFFIIITN